MRIKYDAPIMNDEDKEINCYMRKKTKNDETTKINTDISNTFNCATEFNNNNNIPLIHKENENSCLWFIDLPYFQSDYEMLG